jgi:Tfp pilus assembly protein PilF
MRMGIRMRSFAGLAIGIAISFPVVRAQKPGGPVTGGPAGPGGGRLPPVTGQPTGPAIGSINGDIYLVGNVMLDDGTPPPDPVTIERICGGTPRAQAYTDPKGRFSFQIGQTAGVMQDASEGGSGNTHTASGIGGMGSQQPQPLNGPDTQLSNCDLRAVLSGFRSDTVGLGSRRLMDDPNVGTIVLHRLANVEGSAISMTSLQAPKAARQDYDKGLQDARKNKFAETAKEFQKAVDIYPNYAAAWYELGRVQQRHGEFEQARQAYLHAVSADARFVSPYLQLAELQAKAEKWTELEETTGKLLKLDAVDYPMAYFYHATANLNLGRIEAAEKSARAGEKLDAPHRFPKLEQVLAAILAHKKDYAGAAAHLRTYLILAPDAEDAPRMKKELAEMERLSGGNDQAKAAVDRS